MALSVRSRDAATLLLLVLLWPVVELESAEVALLLAGATLLMTAAS